MRNRAAKPLPKVWRLKACLLVLLFASAVASLEAKEQSANAMRSAYLYYFSHFISWPKTARFDDAELKLCVRTDDPDDRFQLTTIENKPLGDKKLKVVLLDNKNQLPVEQCHMLYVAKNYVTWLAGVRDNIGNNTLLVTEGEFDRPGVIHLFMKENKLKFSIDNSELVNRNFKVSAKLLRFSSRNGT